MKTLQTLSDLMSEDEVYKEYRHIFADKELREARQAGELEYYKLRKGIFYTEEQLLAYLEQRKQQPCQRKPLNLVESGSNPESGNTKTNGSAKKTARLTTIDTSTPEMNELVAKALERRT